MSKFFNLFIITMLFVSCGSNPKLEKKAFVSLEKAFYTEYNSGIRSGNSGLNLHISVSNKNKKLIGVYFRNKYAELKFSKPSIYTGFIVTHYGEKENVDTFSNNKKNKLEKPKELVSIPFSLKPNEAVIVCLIKNKKKYFKILLEKKDTGVPQ